MRERFSMFLKGRKLMRKEGLGAVSGRDGRGGRLAVATRGTQRSCFPENFLFSFPFYLHYVFITHAQCIHRYARGVI